MIKRLKQFYFIAGLFFINKIKAVDTEKKGKQPDELSKNADRQERYRDVERQEKW